MTTVAKKLIDPTEIRRTLSILVEPGQVFEVRVLDAKSDRTSRYTDNLGGYFNDIDMLTKALLNLHSALGIYITLQLCNPDLLHRAHNKLIKLKKDYSTPDKYITHYRWLLIDSDPERVSLISSTEAEHNQALEHSRAIRESLRQQGWPEPILGDSSNGGHLLYLVDLPPEDEPLLKRVLWGLAAKFDIPGVHIDKTVYNPARISKLYGTLACKGDDTSERPHRMSRILEAPGALQHVPRKLLEAIAATDSVPITPSQNAPNTMKKQGTFDLEAWTRQHGIDHNGGEPYEGGTRYILKQCVWDASHTGTSVCILQLKSGAIVYKCQHDSCQGKTWQDVRTKFEPGAYNRKERYQSNGNGAHADTVPEEQEQKEDSQALKLVKMALEYCELFSTPKGEFYARVSIQDRIENLLIGERGGAFKRWLMNLYLEETGTIANPTALSSAISVLEAKAQWGGAAQKEVYVRVAYYNDNLYLDLADKEHNVVEITSAGWKIIKDSPVYFRRPDGMLPLPRPVPGGSLDELRRFINAANEDDWLLIKAWLHGAMHPTGPYPILDMNGERGSAKTCAAKWLRTVVDPHQAPLRKEPKDDQTFAIMAHNSYIVALDNLSHLSSHLSDLMCTLSTGAGDAYRKHYTNDEEVIFNARRAQVFTGIEELATRGDLIDRCIIVKLPTIAEEKRRDEHTLDKEFEEAHPRILGALLDAVSLALRNLPQTHIEKLPRMADFALWVQAAERKLTTEPGAFLAAYKRNREEGVATEIEASPVGQALLKFMEDTTLYESSTADLLAKLKPCVEEEVTKQRTWPKNARALSGALKRLAPSLRATGLHVTQDRTNKGSFVTITRDANPPKSDANEAKSDANFEGVTQKNGALRHSQTEDTRDFTPPVTQSDANNGYFSTWPVEKKEEEEQKNGNGGVDRNSPETLRHFASRFHLNQWVDTPKGPGKVMQVFPITRTVKVGFSPGVSISYLFEQVTEVQA